MKMRKRWTLAAVALAAAVALTGCAMVGISIGFEQPDYTVVAKLGDDVEIRQYGARTYAESRVPTASDDARRDAFRLLFNYIAGANAGETDIKMTIPVAADAPGAEIPMTAPVQTSSDPNTYVMRFFLPAAYTLESAPKPTNPSVRIGAAPPRLEAALRYTGSQSDAKAAAMKKLLLTVLANSAWQAEGAPSALYYNPPFSIPFLRRNEAVVPVRQK